MKIHLATSHMFLHGALCIAVLSSLRGLAYGQDVQPPFKFAFEEYPSKLIKIKKKAPLVTPVDGYDYSDIRRRYLVSPINFSGKYVILTLPCGAGCETGWIVDATTGKMYYLLDVYCSPEPSWTDFKRIEFRRDSSMIILTGKIYDGEVKGGSASRHYYRFDGRDLVLIGIEPIVIK